MKKLALGALLGLAVGLAGCGGGEGSNNNVIIIDSPPVVNPVACDPLAQTGCAEGEKCGNRTLQDEPNEITEIACVPNGTKTQDQACTNGPAGPMGYSDCAAGFECVNSVCKQICDHQGGAPMCDAQHACGRYDGLFESGDMAVAGVCDPKCDPLTQELLAGTNTAACGSQMPAMPTHGCFTFDFVDFTCAGIPTQARDKTDRVPAFGPASGGAYVNGCAAGYVPGIAMATGSMTTICMGLCAPKKSDSTIPEGHVGDRTVPAKLHTKEAPEAGDGVCEPGKKGNALEPGEDCHYLWLYNNDGTDFLPSPYNDTLGLCFGYANYTVDHDGNPNTPRVPYPSCQQIPPAGAQPHALYGNANEWACVPSTEAAFTADKSIAKLNPAARDFRVGIRTGSSVRHIIRQQ